MASEREVVALELSDALYAKIFDPFVLADRVLCALSDRSRSEVGGETLAFVRDAYFSRGSIGGRSLDGMTGAEAFDVAAAWIAADAERRVRAVIEAAQDLGKCAKGDVLVCQEHLDKLWAAVAAFKDKPHA